MFAQAVNRQRAGCNEQPFAQAGADGDRPSGFVRLMGYTLVVHTIASPAGLFSHCGGRYAQLTPLWLSLTRKPRTRMCTRLSRCRGWRPSSLAFLAASSGGTDRPGLRCAHCLLAACAPRCFNQPYGCVAKRVGEVGIGHALIAKSGAYNAADTTSSSSSSVN
jgi:hypothetical protein